MLVKFHYSGHYSPFFVDLTTEELAEARRHEREGYVSATQEGRDFLEKMKGKPHIDTPYISIIAYQ